MTNPLRELIAKATPLPYHTVLYDHGGGRQWKDYPDHSRDLIADYYGEGPDRDLFIFLRNHAEAIADLIDAAQDVVSKESNMQYSELSDDCDDLHAALAKLTEGK